ncbi:nicotinate-nucleotide--dimethylbenzimidazole phosphoribosyltransferase [Wenjunlia vitaminophila]|uniref:Nicotinate-nucleotide--dimethylbenzimidazole phosphoribosyltransferase n=1 Tax=Wenjunlia vitaminophila TaxID=76728 RepID=A0A0T6LUV8_WENVI|nr:nicotinate-nucleotide--dimethylbenzimidazole phosphoribosyltransferase [Wenjunlia vitaminophila]KRV49918.1 nicotinate-nucleotide--dimethylbenzimidazole phosphoribosyltransferase [Wenjunlia vitaminophila]
MSGLSLEDFADVIARPDPAFERAAQERRQRLEPPPTALGQVGELGEWLAAVQGQCPTRPLRNIKVLLFAGDHGVARLGVSAREPGGTVRLVRAVLDGAAPVSVLARHLDVPVRVVDVAVDCDPAELPDEVTRHRVRRGSGQVDVEDALTQDEAERAVRVGMAIADQEADAGTDLVVLGDLSVGGTTVAGVLTAVLCGTDASVVTGRGSGIDDLAWMRKCAAIRDALRRARPVAGDPLRLLATSGGADIAAMVGFLAQCAVRRTPVVLDGVVSAACALVVQRIAFRAPDWWRAGHSSGEPAQAKALDRLTLEPLVDHRIAYGEGTGALLAVPLLRAAAALLAELPERPDAGAADGADTDPGDAADGPPHATEAVTGTDTGTEADTEADAAAETAAETGTPAGTDTKDSQGGTGPSAPGGTDGPTSPEQPGKG